MATHLSGENCSNGGSKPDVEASQIARVYKCRSECLI